MKYNKNIVLVFLAAFIIMAVVCICIIPPSYAAGEAAANALQSDDKVAVTESDEYIVFTPKNTSTAFIFYPGGRVEYTAYGALLHRLAEQDILCILVKMPFDLAVMDMYAAEDIPEQFPSIENWFIGGHSLGGSSAAYHLKKTTDDFSGLVLLASYSSVELWNENIGVCSIFGSEDGVLNLDNYQNCRQNLPDDYQEIVITGGNHSQFGDYGHQKNDGMSTISADEQLHITVDNLVRFFEKMSGE